MLQATLLRAVEIRESDAERALSREIKKFRRQLGQPVGKEVPRTVRQLVHRELAAEVKQVRARTGTSMLVTGAVHSEVEA